MIKTEKKLYEREVITEVVCNVCGKSLETNKHGYFEDFIHLEKTWGYTSLRDGESEVVDICEDCWERIKDIFKIKP